LPLVDEDTSLLSLASPTFCSPYLKV